MIKKISTEFIATRKVEGKQDAILEVFINYKNGTYDICEPGQEGIFPRSRNKDVEKNIVYADLFKEVLEFVGDELYIESHDKSKSAKATECKDICVKENLITRWKERRSQLVWELQGLDDSKLIDSYLVMKRDIDIIIKNLESLEK